MTALKPCPFCGDKMVRCSGDMIKHSEQGECPIGAYAWGATEQATAAWNTRTDISVEALEKIADGKEPGQYVGLNGCRAIARAALSKVKHP